jgi:hypothetical protein
MKKSKGKKKNKEEFGNLPVLNPYESKDEEKKEEKKKHNKVVYEKSCFGGLKIKNQYEQPKINNGEFLPPGCIQILICGSAGSGKSQLILSIIPQLKVSQVVIFSRIDGSPIYSTIEDYCHEKGIDFFISSSLGDAPKTMEEAINQKQPNTFALAIFDDFNEFTTNNENPYMRFINTCTGCLRNYDYHFISVTQNYTGFSTKNRANGGVRFIFKMNDVNALIKLRRDWQNMTGKSIEDFDKLYQIIRPVKHSFLMWTDEGKVFIFLKSEEQKGLQEVEFPEGNLENDTELNRLCKQFNEPVTSIIEKRKHNQIKNSLKKYVRYLSESNGLETVDIEKYMNDKYNIDF